MMRMIMMTWWFGIVTGGWVLILHSSRCHFCLCFQTVIVPTVTSHSLSSYCVGDCNPKRKFQYHHHHHHQQVWNRHIGIMMLKFTPPESMYQCGTVTPTKTKQQQQQQHQVQQRRRRMYTVQQQIKYQQRPFSYNNQLQQPLFGTANTDPLTACVVTTTPTDDIQKVVPSNDKNPSRIMCSMSQIRKTLFFHWMMIYGMTIGGFLNPLVANATPTLPSSILTDITTIFSSTSMGIRILVGLTMTIGIALYQGVKAMVYYQTNFGDAPPPKVPAHGIVIATSSSTAAAVTRTSHSMNHNHNGVSNISKSEWNRTTVEADKRMTVIDLSSQQEDTITTTPQQQQQQQLPPTPPRMIRLLVIGDSLAVGIGQRFTCTPVLPESIAKEISIGLSKQFSNPNGNGSAAGNGNYNEFVEVYWTCQGESGASTSWIVKMLQNSNTIRNNKSTSQKKKRVQTTNQIMSVPVVATRNSTTNGIIENEIVINGNEKQILSRYVHSCNNSSSNFVKEKDVNNDLNNIEKEKEIEIEIDTVDTSLSYEIYRPPDFTQWVGKNKKFHGNYYTNGSDTFVGSGIIWSLSNQTNQYVVSDIAPSTTSANGDDYDRDQQQHQQLRNGRQDPNNPSKRTALAMMNTTTSTSAQTQLDLLRSYQRKLETYRNNFDPNAMGPYDIVVILTGANDLKTLLFPFLLNDNDNDIDDDDEMDIDNDDYDDIIQPEQQLNNRKKMRDKVVVRNSKKKKKRKRGSSNSLVDSIQLLMRTINDKVERRLLQTLDVWKEKADTILCTIRERVEIIKTMIDNSNNTLNNTNSTNNNNVDEDEMFVVIQQKQNVPYNNHSSDNETSTSSPPTTSLIGGGIWISTTTIITFLDQFMTRMEKIVQELIQKINELRNVLLSSIDKNNQMINNNNNNIDDEDFMTGQSGIPQIHISYDNDNNSKNENHNNNVVLVAGNTTGTIISNGNNDLDPKNHSSHTTTDRSSPLQSLVGPLYDTIIQTYDTIRSNLEELEHLLRFITDYKKLLSFSSLDGVNNNNPNRLNATTAISTMPTSLDGNLSRDDETTPPLPKNTGTNNHNATTNTRGPVPRNTIKYGRDVLNMILAMDGLDVTRPPNMVGFSTSTTASTGSNTSTRSTSRRNRTTSPLFVLPGLPARSLPIFRHVPLRWFVVPIFDWLNSKKEQLSGHHRQSKTKSDKDDDQQEILYITDPTLRDMIEYENQCGTIWDGKQKEIIVLSLQDIRKDDCIMIEESMEQYFQKKGSGLSRNDTITTIQGIPGTKIFSPDRIHPNDYGYDLWGRHIGKAIVKHLNGNER